MGKGNKNKKSNKTLITGITLIAAALIIIGIGLFMIFRDNKRDENVVTPGKFAVIGEEDSATACQNLMSEYYSAIMGEDGKALYKLMAPPEYWSYYMNTYSKTEEEIIKTYNDAINNTKTEWQAKCGDDAKVSFQITASGEEPEEFLKNWNDNVGSLCDEQLTAEEALRLNVTQTVKGQKDNIESNNSPILIKVNGHWYILNEGIEEN